jgi:hypothetical protein
MNKVYIYNKNAYPLREMFKGEEVTLAANDFWRDKAGNKKEIDIFEANDFRGQYHPVPFDGSGKMINDPKYFKMIEMIPVSHTEVKEELTPTFKCMAKDCKHVSPSPEELEAHTKVKHGGLEKLTLPDEDARLSKKKTA